MMIKILLTTFFLSSSFLFIGGCDREIRAHKLPLTLNIVDKNLCLYTESKNSFLDENDKTSYFLVVVKSFKQPASASIYEKQVTLKEHSFPFKKENCVLVPINLLELNEPYQFIIYTGKSFSTRACILQEGNGYTIKKVHSTENCDE